MENQKKKNPQNKYRDTHYKQLAIAIKPKDFEMIDEYCKENGASKASLIVKACRYVIDNDIDIFGSGD